MIIAYKNSNIYYTETGEGSALILLHGFLETTDMWTEFIPELSKNKRVISIDLLGHGQTDCIGYVHTMEAMADAVLHVLNHLKVEKAKFIGHSMGGYVALALAEKLPQLFTGLCLMNSTFEADTEERKLLRTRAVKMAHTNYKSLVRMSFANLFAPESKTKFKNEYSKGLQIALKTPLQGYIAAQKGMQLRPSRLHVFENFKGKKLVIVGEKDALIGGKKLLNKITNTDINFEELSEGHMSHIENKSELTYIINHFVEK